MDLIIQLWSNCLRCLKSQQKRCLHLKETKGICLPRNVSNQQRLNIAVWWCLSLREGSVVFAKCLILRDIRIKINQVFQIRDTIGQGSYSKIFAGEWLEHEDLALVYWWETIKTKTSVIGTIFGSIWVNWSPPTQAMVTPPSSESENRRRKVPRRHCFNMSSVCLRPTNPIIVLQTNGIRNARVNPD